MICFTKSSAGLAYTSEMAQKAYQRSFEPLAGIGNDYALIATSVAAAVVALIYFILI